MKKLLFIAPHLSTGGLPQYLTKKIELLKDEFDIHLVEWVDCTGGVLVVTKNKVTQLVAPEKFYTLDDNKQRLIDIINDIQPDIIHLEEIPEFFMDDNIAQQIYTQDRNYKIVETSHDSSYNIDNKKFYTALLQHKKNLQEAIDAGLPEPRIPPYIGECLFKIATRLSLKPNFIGYT